MFFPFEINDAPEHVNKELWSCFRAEKEKYVQVGPKKYLLCPKYRHQAAGIYNQEVRPDDVWVVTFPRSGTTWTQELVWLINNDYDYEKAKSIKLGQRFPFIESGIIVPDNFREELIKLNQMTKEAADAFRKDGDPNFYRRIEKMTSPRHIKTHLPLSLLPPKLLDTCKLYLDITQWQTWIWARGEFHAQDVAPLGLLGLFFYFIRVIYVARNPKDVAVSCYYQNANLNFIGYDGDFEKYWDLFRRDLVLWAPYWSHVEEGWKMMNHPNMLFLFYEDMSKDLPSVLRKVAAFLNKPITEEQINKLVSVLTIESFRNNPSMNNDGNLKGVFDDTKPGFFRQGKSGGWKNEFSPEMNAKADEWIKAHEKNTDLRFQYEI